ncbi:hypothetical protein SAMN05445850_6016 [Paraburkholderia tuberum]|uniref:Uncharacterized protein n=1 Tax=Paraburkholderia tuberum TaxID=157910 RepID=A0A1H1JYM8_9BURK|nr:hypothetical protein SAMN05445850_6016 [Paraburkholderia tuberum]
MPDQPLRIEALSRFQVASSDGQLAFACKVKREGALEQDLSGRQATPAFPGKRDEVAVVAAPNDRIGNAKYGFQPLEVPRYGRIIVRKVDDEDARPG